MKKHKKENLIKKYFESKHIAEIYIKTKNRNRVKEKNRIFKKLKL